MNCMIHKIFFTWKIMANFRNERRNHINTVVYTWCKRKPKWIKIWGISVINMFLIFLHETRYEVSTTLKIRIVISCVMISCSVVGYRRFGRPCCLKSSQPRRPWLDYYIKFAIGKKITDLYSRCMWIIWSSGSLLLWQCFMKIHFQKYPIVK
jgi:hypothetical protein